MKIAIASDHGGFELKEEIYNYLKNKGYDIENFGTNSSDSCDYPFFANSVSTAVLEGKFNLGILICWTGIGMSIAANRHKGIRAACVSDTYSARLTREHNDSNVLCFGARVVGSGLAKEIVDTWLNAQYQGGHHQKRVDMLDL